jgi:sodium/proline symporter
MPLALINFAPPFITAFVLVAVIAAVMSTSNAFLNLGAAAIMHDVVGEYMDKDLTDEQDVLYGRITTAAVLIGAFLLAAGSGSLVFVLGAAGWGILVSVLLPGIVFGYNWRGATTEGLLAGGTTALVLTLVLAYGSQFGVLSLPMGFLGGQVATVIGIVVFLAVSFVTSSNTYEDLDERTRIAMDTPRLGGTPSSSRREQEGVPSDD